MHSCKYPVILLGLFFVILAGCENNSSEQSNNLDTSSDSATDTFPVCTFRESPLGTPPGPYCVGAVNHFLKDPNREEPFTPDNPTDRREIEVRIFYPATPDTGIDYGVYHSSKLAQSVAAEANMPEMESVLQNVPVNFKMNADVASTGKPFPVLLFSPGWGGNIQNSIAMLEAMASQGYVIAAVNHPYLSGLVECPDGRVIETDESASLEEIHANLSNSIPLMTADMAQALDFLTTLNTNDPDGRLTGRVDLSRVGAIGHSLGGAVAVAMLQTDARVLAAVDMDGSLYDLPLYSPPAGKPVMFHLAGDHTLKADFSISTYWQQLQGQEQGFAVYVETAGHWSYLDAPMLIANIVPGETTGVENQGTIDALTMFALTRDYNLAFFNTYLKGQTEDALSSLEIQYSEASVKKSNDPAPPDSVVKSEYIQMSDGVKIAVDVWLPGEASASNPVPAVIRATRYWRDIEVTDRTMVPFTESEMEAAVWNDAGMALVLVDVRGTGASFGTWTAPWSPREVQDLGEVVDWIVAKEWSNGKVGAQGISYDGNTADFIGLLDKSAVKIVAPLFSDYRVYRDITYPGGIFNEGFIDAWNDGNAPLDANDICAVTGTTGDDCLDVKLIIPGVKPTDEDMNQALLTQATLQHQDNFNIYDGAREAPFVDSHFNDITYTDFSPSGLSDRMDADAPFYFVYASWSDAATALGALTRYMTSESNSSVMIGAWSHGGEYNTDPFMAPDASAAPSYEEQQLIMTTVFGQYLGNVPQPARRTIQYYTMGEGEWRESPIWPPADVVESTLYLSKGNRLSAQSPSDTSSATAYAVDFSATTGMQNRWWTQNGGDDVVYENRAAQDSRLLVFSSEPFTSDRRITGNPVAKIHLASTHEDGALYVYLEDVAPDGTITYLTEGQLRLIHRKISDPPPSNHVFGPYHSFLEADAAPMTPGQPEEIAIALQPVAALIEAGHAVRIALAGHDGANFTRLPATGDPTLTVYHDTTRPSHIVLPFN